MKVAGKYKLPIGNEITSHDLKSLLGVFVSTRVSPRLLFQSFSSPFFHNEMAGGRKYGILARTPIGKISWRVRRDSASVGEPGE